MTAGYFNHADAASTYGLPTAIEDAEDFTSLAPILAGARARGLADAFELEGTAALFLDETGSVLHVGARARGLLDGALSIVSRNLVAETASANRGLERLIAGAICGAGDVRPVFVDRDGADAIEVRALHFADGANDPMQLLKAILILRQVPASV